MADPFLDALGVKDPTEAPAAKAPAAKGKGYDPYDLAVRLTMLEEADPSARQWVAGVMANRAKKAKGDLLSVLTAPRAFEAFTRRREELDAIDPNSDDYKTTAAQVLPILQGKAPDPTGGAVNFYAPEAQAQLAPVDGRPAKAEFDDGTGVKVGKTLFFGGKGSAPDGFLSAIGVNPEAAQTATADEADLTSASLTPYRGLKEKLTPKQQALYIAMNKGGSYDPEGAGGSQANPYFMQSGMTDKDVPAGAYYVDRDGKPQRAPGGPKESSFGAGLGQGVADVALSVGHMLPGTDDSTIKNLLLADGAMYGAEYGGDLKSGLGRFTGQVVGSAPVLAGGEGVVAPVLSKLGPVGEFLLGNAGKGMEKGMARLAVRDASLSAKGAMEGAGAAGLVSSSDDRPLLEQMAEGAAGGAVLGPALHGIAAVGKNVGRGIARFVEPFTDRGAAKAADRGITEIMQLGDTNAPDLTEHVPGSTPTLAQATGNAPLAQLERNLRENFHTQQIFANAEARNNAARQAVVADAQGDPGTVADLGRNRAAIVDAHRERVFGAAGTADAAPVVDHIDAALQSPEAVHPEVVPALQKVRNGLVTEPETDLTPEESAAFHKAALATAGGDGTALTPEAMDAARGKLGAKFEEIAKNTEVPWDDHLRGDIGAIIHDTAQVVPESSLPPLFKQLDNIASTANDGKTLSGATYQALTKKGAPLDSLMNSSDPTIRQAASKIRNALDDALERSVAAKPAVEGQPNPVEDLRATRLAYKNLKTLEAARRTAGPDGVITPRALYNAVKQNFGSYTYKGAGPLGDVAEEALNSQNGKGPVFEENPRQMFALREHLTGVIDKLSKAGETDDASRAAAARLADVRDHMDAALGHSVPGYEHYRAVADATAEPIEAQRYLQSLPLKTNGPNGGTVTLNLVNKALDRIEKGRSLPGPHPAKAVSEATITQLHALQADLEREANRDLGKAKGSPTNQLATSQVEMAGMGIPSVVAQHIAGKVPLIGSHVAAGVRGASETANRRVMTAMANRLVHPDLAPTPVPEAPKPAGPVRKAVRRVGSVTPGVVGGLVGTRLLGQ